MFMVHIPFNILDHFHFLGCLPCYIRLSFLGCLHFLGLLSFGGRFHFQGHFQNLSVFVTQRTIAPKNGVDFRPKSVGNIRNCLATSYDVVRRRGKIETHVLT